MSEEPYILAISRACCPQMTASDSVSRPVAARVRHWGPQQGRWGAGNKPPPRGISGLKLAFHDADMRGSSRECRRVVQLATGITSIRMSDVLRILNLPTLKYRRYRGDMIELFKMIKGIYDPMCIPRVEFRELSEDLIRTRGNRYKRIQH